MTDTERKDLAQAYQLMMQSAAWKHFEASLNLIAEKATKDEDSIDTLILAESIGFIGECRGRRAAIHKIRLNLSYVLEGLK